MVIFFFFKQKTAYEMRISDWSSDVCSSDLKDSRYIRRLWQYAETAASLTVQPGGAEGVRDRRRAVPDKESALKQESQPLCYRTRVAFDRCGLTPVEQRSRRPAQPGLAATRHTNLHHCGRAHFGLAAERQEGGSEGK